MMRNYSLTINTFPYNSDKKYVPSIMPKYNNHPTYTIRINTSKLDVIYEAFVNDEIYFATPELKSR